MGYNPIEVSQAASRALDELRKDGGAGYVETQKTVHVPETVVPWSEIDNGFIHNFPDKPLGRGEVTLFVDGIQYTLFFAGDNGYSDLSIGSYYVVLHESSVSVHTTADDVPESITISLTQNVEITHPINEKFLSRIPGSHQEYVPCDIPLDNFGVGEVIAALFAQGGGNFTSEISDAMLEDLGTIIFDDKYDMHFTQQFGGGMLTAKCASQIYNETQLVLNYNFAIPDETGIALAFVSIVIDNTTMSCTIFVKVV